MILGQALVFAEPLLLLGYGGVVAIAVPSFVRWYEEPSLTRRFGEHYTAYRRAVPGWWPKRPAEPKREIGLSFPPVLSRMHRVEVDRGRAYAGQRDRPDRQHQQNADDPGSV